MISQLYLQWKRVLKAEERGRQELNAFPIVQELEDTHIHEASMGEETARVLNGRERYERKGDTDSAKSEHRESDSTSSR